MKGIESKRVLRASLALCLLAWLASCDGKPEQPPSPPPPPAPGMHIDVQGEQGALDFRHARQGRSERPLG